MKFKEILEIINGYVNYFNFMHRSKIKIYKNMHLKIIEIRSDEEKNSEKILTFYMGNLSKSLDVTIEKNISINMFAKLVEKKIEIKNMKINMNSKNEIHDFFKIVEQESFFEKNKAP